jgi:hypothetical protein
MFFMLMGLQTYFVISVESGTFRSESSFGWTKVLYTWSESLPAPSCRFWLIGTWKFYQHPHKQRNLMQIDGNNSPCALPAILPIQIEIARPQPEMSRKHSSCTVTVILPKPPCINLYHHPEWVGHNHELIVLKAGLTLLHPIKKKKSSAGSIPVRKLTF